MKVKLARIKKGLTQDELRRLVRTSPKTLVAIEKGNYDNVTLKLMKAIANVLDETVENLFLNKE